MTDPHIVDATSMPPPPPGPRRVPWPAIAVVAAVIAAGAVVFAVTRSNGGDTVDPPSTAITLPSGSDDTDALVATLTAERDAARAEVEQLAGRVSELEAALSAGAEGIDPAEVEELRSQLSEARAGREAAEARLAAMLPIDISEVIDEALVGVYTIAWGQAFRCDGMPDCRVPVTFDQAYVDRDPDSNQLRMVVTDVTVMPLDVNGFGNGVFGGSSASAVTMACPSDPNLPVSVEFSVSTGVRGLTAGPDGSVVVGELVGTLYSFTDDRTGCAPVDVGVEVILTRVAS